MGALDIELQSGVGRDGKDLASIAVGIPSQQEPYDFRRLAQCPHRSRRLNPDLLEPGASCQPEIRPTIRCEVEGRNLTGDFDGVRREGVQARRAESNAA